LWRVAVFPQPKVAARSPTVLYLHGGAWNAKDRTAEEPMDRAIASSGGLVVAIYITLPKEAPYPASVQDANYREVSPVPRLASGCELRRPMAEVESRHMEWRRIKARDLRKLERRPRR